MATNTCSEWDTTDVKLRPYVGCGGVPDTIAARHSNSSDRRGSHTYTSLRMTGAMSEKPPTTTMWPANIAADVPSRNPTACGCGADGGSHRTRGIVHNCAFTMYRCRAWPTSSPSMHTRLADGDRTGAAAAARVPDAAAGSGGDFESRVADDKCIQGTGCE